MKEKLFSPWSLVRVARAVEWEYEVVWDKDGTTNQGEYVKAIGILVERWLAEDALPYAAELAYDVMGQKYAEALAYALTNLKRKISQFVGFWRGLWEGANPRVTEADIPTWPPIPGVGIPATSARAVIDSFIRELRLIVEPKEGDP